MLGNKRPKPREAEHLAHGVMSLYQPVSVEQYCLAGFKYGLLLLIAHPWHEPQGHPPCPQLLAITTTPQVGQVVACVCVHQGTTLRVEDGAKAGDKLVGWDTGQHCLVDPRQYLFWRGAQGCGYASEQGARRAHHEGRWHSFTRGVPHGEAHPAVIYLEEVVEVSSYLPSRQVVRSDLPVL